MKKIISLLSMVFVSSLPLAAKPEVNNDLVLLDVNNHLLLNGEINEQSSSDFIGKLLIAGTKSDNILVYISSPGGSVLSGMKIVQVANDLKVKNNKLKITCYADFAASMAFVITQTICDTRLVGLTSTLMQHQATFGVNGREGEVNSRLDMILSILKIMDEAQAKRLKISVEELRRKTRDEWWLVGDEVVKNKAADRKASLVCTKELVESKRKQKIQSFFGKAEVTWSGCPLLEYPIKVEVATDGLTQEEKAKIEKKIYELIENRKKTSSLSP